MRREQGFSLIVAIFVLLVVAILAATMARLTGGGAHSIAFEVQSLRAHHAARSALEWAGATIHQTLDVNKATACSSASIQGKSLSFTDAGLNGCTASLSCALVSPGDLMYGDATVYLYHIASQGRCGLGTSAAERELEGLIMMTVSPSPPS